MTTRAIENAILPYYAYVRPEYLSRLGSRVGGDIAVKLAGPPELPKNVFQMLSRIGPYLHRNVLLLQKVSASMNDDGQCDLLL